ncbi:DUF3127 domain-containing protein [Tellurirhabdus bombi]|uniref:DUF3127 domain-containing protein n=1 Tax=Tellurirhabdus bombi TaxID=2907205 RepID=UPI001F1B491D|nr:DUF3127 domain-containing protein [Tellurirhabdus bombi]
MALEVIGKLLKVLPEQTGQGKNGAWVKQNFVVETIDQFPKQVCFLAWGEKANDLKQFATGDTLRVLFSLESREYNDRWYTDVRAWRIELAEGETASAPAASAPAARPSESKAPAKQQQPLTSFYEEDGNELPF